MNTQLQTRPGALLAPQLDYILLDGSGSMKDKWWDTMAAIDAFMADLKTANLNAHAILSTFWGPEACAGVIQRDLPLADWKSLISDPVGAGWGTTPLYDAINSMGRHVGHQLNPNRASVIIATDGEEGGSQTTLDQAKAVLNWLRAKGYQITFIGCDFNNSQTAKQLGADPSSALGISKHLLTDAAHNLAKKRTAYGLYGTPMHFTEGEQQQFGGLLPPPSAAA